MSESDLKSIISKSIDFAGQRMKNLRSSHGWDHVQRVMHLAERIAVSEKADLFIVKIASILHDIAREDENRSSGDVCHAELGSKIAFEFLLEQGLDRARAEHISRCIIEHRYRNNCLPSTLESMVVYDADKLDSIGAIGIGRAFLFSGEIGAKLHDPDIDISSTMAYTEQDTAYREFTAKLKFIKDRMQTSEGKKIAQERHKFMISFFNQLQDESKGIL